MISGRAWVFGDHISSDAIVPARYLNQRNPRSWAGVVLADLRPEFAEQLGFGDFIVAGRNFGCGSSREQAPMAIKTAGVGAVIAHSFSRMFYRNAFNLGLPVFACPEAASLVHDGDRLRLDLFSGAIQDLDQESSFQAEAVDPYLAEMVSAGGLIKKVRKQITGH
ncbi:MAG: 3-isopropylmalate dehydratase small subunit [Desulfarculaceae bacterium]|nr:3-isopropylmalate dehydratase small subunit [Desulfarculaceae bacterium]MCF8070998.1 3-isopropylmalate dehydratase small subunit [Desulfarculaceae bacterium]MCF8100586.1 3-isopropylmalate dehydratase small subunit [Desulfarculaceae bacterium]MCF8117718.1 3-isopropylmalate dehydratase small subunit [Desulfarculaceae bacterium]